MRGAGMGVTVVKHASGTGTLFSIPLLGTDEAVVEYGGNSFRDMTMRGTSAANSAKAVTVKNKVNILFDHVEIVEFGTLISGFRDNAGNSVNSLSVQSCRLGQCKTAVYAPRQWNGLHIGGATQFFACTDWALIVYDADGVHIDSSVAFDGTPTAASTGHICFGGVTGFHVGSYHEGAPTADHFIRVSSGKDKDGNTTLGGIAINDSRGGVLHGVRGSSAIGVAYVIKLDGCSGVSVVGRAASGVSTAIAYLTPTMPHWPPTRLERSPPLCSRTGTQSVALTASRSEGTCGTETVCSSRWASR
jgi:hypothetical protein